MQTWCKIHTTMPANSTMPIYLSIQLASSGASTSTIGTLSILCWDSNRTASATLVSDLISTTGNGVCEEIRTIKRKKNTNIKKLVLMSSIIYTECKKLVWNAMQIYTPHYTRARTIISHREWTRHENTKGSHQIVKVHIILLSLSKSFCVLQSYQMLVDTWTSSRGKENQIS